MSTDAKGPEGRPPISAPDQMKSKENRLELERCLVQMYSAKPSLWDL